MKDLSVVLGLMDLLQPSPATMHRLEHADGTHVMAELTEGSGPTVVYLSGYGSNMQGNKPTWLSHQSSIWGQRFIRFDYRGTGLSSGEFNDQTLGKWLDDTLLVLDRLKDGPAILIGSSMGTWLALRAATLQPSKIASLLLISSAPDFTKRYWDQLSEDEKTQAAESKLLPLERRNPLTFDMVHEANHNHLILGGPIAFDGPTEMVHGLRDDIADVEITHCIVDALASERVTVTLVKDGDHSLSRPQDLSLIWQALTRLREQVMAVAE